ncbi:MAG: hypothetical protein ACYDEV_13035 [Acidiferrobacter sp.]
MNPDIYIRAPVALGHVYSFRPTRPQTGGDAFDQAVTDSVQKLCGQQLRQASRFIRLAAAGALACAQKAALPATGGVYLATGLGDQGSGARLFAQTHTHEGRASPFDFVNVNSNTATYAIARIAGLAGPNLTISQGALSFEWALRLALTDIQGGLTHALVGGVDEKAPTRLELVRRFRLGRGHHPGEGSGWLVLTTQREKAQARFLGMRWFATPRAADWQELWGYCTDLAGTRVLHLSAGLRVPKARTAALVQTLPNTMSPSYLAHCGYYPTAAAFGIAQGVGSTSGLWAHVSSSGRGQTVLTFWEALDAA